MQSRQKSNRVRFTVEDLSKNSYYQLHKFLFNPEFEDLSNDARVLYALLQDRFQLSLKNKWVNDHNEVYVIFSRKEMEKILRLSDKTVKKAIESLKHYGLLEEEHRGLNEPNRIYLTAVTLINSGDGESPIPESENLRVRNRKNSDSGIEKTPIQESEKLRDNKTEYQLDLSSVIQSINHEVKTDPIDKMDASFYRKLIAENIEYDVLREEDPALLDDILEIMVDTVVSQAENIVIAKERKPYEVVRSAFLKMNSWHLSNAVNRIKNYAGEIKNRKAFLRTCLYNASLTDSSGLGE